MTIMVKFLNLRVFHWLGVMGLCLPLGAQSMSLLDDRGVSVSFDASPQRVVSLLPSLTETVCQLNQCQRLVGVDRYSDSPALVQSLPKVGGGLDPSLEAIVALKPDLVLLAKSSRVGERLQALGLKTFALEPKTHWDVQRIILILGQILEVQDPLNLWLTIDSGITVAAKTLPPSLAGTRVYFEVNRGPYAAGESSFIGQTLARLGVKNIVPASLGPFPKLNPEFVVRANPDLIMLSQVSFAELAQRPGWSQIRALQDKRVCVFSAEEGNILVRPGPRMIDAARWMARCLSDHLPIDQRHPS